MCGSEWKESELTRSMTTSHAHVCRHSAATLHTCATASTSSALTWKTGAPTTRATSVQYADERLNRGSVVKPIYSTSLQSGRHLRGPRVAWLQQSGWTATYVDRQLQDAAPAAID